VDAARNMLVRLDMEEEPKDLHEGTDDDGQ
jgi:hypothetical protein